MPNGIAPWETAPAGRRSSGAGNRRPGPPAGPPGAGTTRSRLRQTRPQARHQWKLSRRAPAARVRCGEPPGSDAGNGRLRGERSSGQVHAGKSRTRVRGHVRWRSGARLPPPAPDRCVRGETKELLYLPGMALNPGAAGRKKMCGDSGRNLEALFSQDTPEGPGDPTAQVGEVSALKVAPGGSASRAPPRRWAARVRRRAAGRHLEPSTAALPSENRPPRGERRRHGHARGRRGEAPPARPAGRVSSRRSPRRLLSGQSAGGGGGRKRAEGARHDAAAVARLPSGPPSPGPPRRAPPSPRPPAPGGQSQSRARDERCLR
ncbi:basic salivary proline-rich protein 4-like [Camelus dromedarius]|uniref:basic salivary proline-rich protein 4-like n=1 Tax=Camelus dromedarius TaxID=9838 RepID=UPI003119C77E